MTVREEKADSGAPENAEVSGVCDQQQEPEPEPEPQPEQEPGQEPEPEVEVRVDGERLAAVVVIPGNFDPDLLDTELIAQCAQASDVLVDLDVERRIEAIVERFQAAPGQIEATLAEATAAIDGEEGRLEWVEGCDPTNIQASDQQAQCGDDRIDFYNVLNYLRVEKGMHVATLHHPLDGVDGRDVTGRVLSAVPGKKCDVSVDASLDVDDSGRISASINGVLQFQQRTLKVTRVLAVEEYVDFSTGNINFDGSVTVKEGVRDCFEVKATENISINGLIEAATIMCGKDFRCPCGMAGRDRGRLIVDGNAQINFLNNVIGRVNGNLTVFNEMINCQFAVGGNLDCGQGSIIGGTLVVGGSVIAQEIGSASGVETTLMLGESPILKAGLQRLEQYVLKTKSESEVLLEELAALRTQTCQGETKMREQFTKLACAIQHRSQMLKACRLKAEHLRGDLDDARQIDVQVHGGIHHRVRLIFDHHELMFGELHEGPLQIFRDDEGMVQIRQGDGSLCPINEVARDLHEAA